MDKKKKIVDGQEVTDAAFKLIESNSNIRLKLITEEPKIIQYKTLTKLEG